jgi:5-formyltetrahydrofolate cyclo-ligase
MNKQELRLYFKDLLIKNQDKINSDLVRNSLINKISRLLKELKIQTVGLYYPLKYEINLLEITNLLPEIRFFLPKVITDEIKYCSYKSNDELVLGDFKTYEPINNNFYKPELIIIPGLAFSNDGYRLGYGKGHFDRYLNNNRNILTVGICLKEQLIDNFPVESHDHKLNFVISVSA